MAVTKNKIESNLILNISLVFCKNRCVHVTKEFINKGFKVMWNQLTVTKNEKEKLKMES